jgi:hypothetical protein
MSRTMKLAENRHCGSGMIWTQVKGACDLKMIGKLPFSIFAYFSPISAIFRQRHVAYGVLRFSQLRGLIQHIAFNGMVAFALFSIRSICPRKTRQRLRRHRRQLCTRARKKRKPVMDFLLAYLRQNMSSIWLGTESTIRSTRCWGNAP